MYVCIELLKCGDYKSVVPEGYITDLAFVVNNSRTLVNSNNYDYDCVTTPCTDICIAHIFSYARTQTLLSDLLIDTFDKQEKCYSIYVFLHFPQFQLVENPQALHCSFPARAGTLVEHRHAGSQLDSFLLYGLLIL